MELLSSSQTSIISNKSESSTSYTDGKHLTNFLFFFFTKQKTSKTQRHNVSYPHELLLFLVDAFTFALREYFLDQPLHGVVVHRVCIDVTTQLVQVFTLDTGTQAGSLIHLYMKCFVKDEPLIFVNRKHNCKQYLKNMKQQLTYNNQLEIQ